MIGNARDGYGDTPLLLAAVNGHTEVIKRLLAEGADPDLKDNQGCTALLLAARNGHVKAVELSLTTGQTPLMWAMREGHGDVVKLLKAAE